MVDWADAVPASSPTAASATRAVVIVLNMSQPLCFEPRRALNLSCFELAVL
jgi:hypothetical protein